MAALPGLSLVPTSTLGSRDCAGGPGPGPALILSPETVAFIQLRPFLTWAGSEYDGGAGKPAWR